MCLIAPNIRSWLDLDTSLKDSFEPRDWDTIKYEQKHQYKSKIKEV